MNGELLPFVVAIPLGTAFLIVLLCRRMKTLAAILANLASLALLIISLLLFGARVLYKIGGWSAPLGINWVLDGFSNFLLLIISVVSFAATVFSVRYMEKYSGHYKYYALFLLMVAGMNGVVLSGDLFNLFVFLEIAAVASYALVAFGCRHEELEASFKYMVLGSLGSTLILFAIAFFYGTTGYLTMSRVREALSVQPLNPLIILAAVFFLVGFGIKAALVPFHPWLPDAHPSAPAPISAMLSGVLIKALGIYTLIRVFFTVIGITPVVGMVFMVLGLLSMIVGVFLAVGQWDLKRLLAYHSISQMGYVMLGVGLGAYLLASRGSLALASLGILGGLFHLANHSVFKSLLFLCSGSLEYSTGTRQLKEMGGLAKRMPVTRATCTVAALSIAGIPPFNGFWSKLLIVMAAVQAGFYLVAALTVLVSFITLVSFLKVLRYSFLGALPEKLRKVKEAPLLMTLPLVVLAVLCLGMGVLLLPGLREYVLEPAVAVLVRGLEAGVLGGK